MWKQKHTSPECVLGISPNMWGGRYGSPFTICPTEEGFTSTALHPEPSQPTLTSCTEIMLEPTADSETEPVPHRRSDQVRELATSPVLVGSLVEFPGHGGKPCPHTPVAVEELCLVSGNYLEEMEVCMFHCPQLVPSNTKSPVSPEFPSSLSWLVHFSPSASPLTPLHYVDSPGIYNFSALSRQADHPALPPATDSTSVRRPLGFSLGSTKYHHPCGCTWLPRPSGSALVGCRPVIAALLLSAWLRLASSFASVLGPWSHLRPWAPWLHLGCWNIKGQRN